MIDYIGLILLLQPNYFILYGNDYATYLNARQKLLFYLLGDDYVAYLNA